jgi:peroxiredoxin-like protein
VSQPPYFYENDVTWIVERRADLTSVGLPGLEVAAPPEFQGRAGVWTPEHLFVASVNTCFLMTFLAIAEMSKLEFSRFSSFARGKLEKVEGSGLQITEIVIRPKITVRHKHDVERAARIVEKSEKNCLISKSIKSTIKLETEIDSEEF